MYQDPIEHGMVAAAGSPAGGVLYLAFMAIAIPIVLIVSIAKDPHAKLIFPAIVLFVLFVAQAGYGDTTIKRAKNERMRQNIVRWRRNCLVLIAVTLVITLIINL